MARAGLRIALWLCLATAVNGQIVGLATTDDGSVLYFSTPFNLAGAANPTSANKIYIYDANGLRLYSDRFPEQAGIPEPIGTSNPWVSGDGSVVAYQGTYTTNGCYGFAFCIPPMTYTLTAIQRESAAPEILNTAAILSANGQYAVTPYPVLLDLTTGASTAIPSPSYNVAVTPDSVASDGTVLLHICCPTPEQTYYAWAPGAGLRNLSLAAGSAVMNDAATTVVYSQGIALYLYNLATGASYLFANGSAPSISRDGQWVAFLSPVTGVLQAWAVPAGQSEFLQLSSDPFGVASVVISGSGNVVYAVTGANAIWKYDLIAGAATQVVPPTPAPAFSATLGGVIGSQVSIPVTGLVAQTIAATPPLPSGLAGYQVLLNGSPAPIVSISPAALVFQIPWETPALNYATIQLQAMAANAVLQSAPGMIFIDSFLPRFLTTPCGAPVVGQCLVAAHADGTAVSSSNPAQAGEVVNFPMTGLGAVAPPIPTGAAAPASPPTVVQHPFVCQLVEVSGSSQTVLGDLQMLSAVIPPGAVGTYLVAARLPVAFGDTSYAGVTCQGAGYYAAGYLPVAL